MVQSNALAAVGYEPDELKNRPWLFTFNVIKVYVSPVEYIQFGPETIAYLSPSRSGIVVGKQVEGTTLIRVYMFVSPVWLYSAKYTKLWLQTGEDRLGLQLGIVSTR